MLIENSFDVDADPDRVFTFLQNPHNVATCFPGAELTEDLGDDQYRGKVKIKLGPVTAAFSGIARITEKDDVARIAVLVAEGKDARGSGTAKATATMRVEPTETGSNVLLKTDLTISGKLAQFGRGIMADVSGRMVNDLAVRVRERIESEPESGEAAEVAAAKPAEAAPESKPETVTEAPAETAATPDAEPETTAAAVSKSKTVAEAPAEAPVETTTAAGGTSEAAAGADSGVVSGATTETATAAATAKSAAKPAATPAASSEPAGAIKATTLVKVMVAGMFRRLFARLRGRSHSA